MLRPKIFEGFLSLVIIWPSATISLTPECPLMLQNFSFIVLFVSLNPFVSIQKSVSSSERHGMLLHLLYISLRAWTGPGMSWRLWLAGMNFLSTLRHQFISCGLILCLLQFRLVANRIQIIVWFWSWTDEILVLRAFSELSNFHKTINRSSIICCSNFCSWLLSHLIFSLTT